MHRIISKISLYAVFALAFASTTMAALENTKTLEGTIANVKTNVLTVMEQASDQLKIAVQIQVNKDTEFKEISSLRQLKEGDQVEVSYKEQDGEKIATSVEKIKSNDEES